MCLACLLEANSSGHTCIGAAALQQQLANVARVPGCD
ncbi:unnamed protein product [Ectocarpus sp. 6 AP-2014]